MSRDMTPPFWAGSTSSSGGFDPAHSFWICFSPAQMWARPWSGVFSRRQPRFGDWNEAQRGGIGRVESDRDGRRIGARRACAHRLPTRFPVGQLPTVGPPPDHPNIRTSELPDLGKSCGANCLRSVQHLPETRARNPAVRPLSRARIRAGRAQDHGRNSAPCRTSSSPKHAAGVRESEHDLSRRERRDRSEGLFPYVAEH